MRKSKDSSITNILKLIAPGTPIRDGLENILKAIKTTSYEGVEVSTKSYE